MLEFTTVEKKNHLYGAYSEEALAIVTRAV